VWLKEWSEGGAEALRDGNLAVAWPLMLRAKDFDGSVLPAALDVQRKAEALDAALANLTAVGAELEKQGRAAALATLIDWARVVHEGKELDKRGAAPLRAFLEGGQLSSWERARKMAEAYAPRVAKTPALADELVTKLGAIKGLFAAELLADLRAAGTDPSALAALLEHAAQRPGQWLARAFFHW
jgi:hypothetical protein